MELFPNWPVGFRQLPDSDRRVSPVFGLAARSLSDTLLKGHPELLDTAFRIGERPPQDGVRNKETAVPVSFWLEGVLNQGNGFVFFDLPNHDGPGTHPLVTSPLARTNFSTKGTNCGR